MKKLMVILILLSFYFQISCKKGNTSNDPYNRTASSSSTSTSTRGQTGTLSAQDIQKIIQGLKKIKATPVQANEFGFIKTNYGLIKIKFFPDKAPNTCANFKKLANSGFYNGTTFHRVVPKFVIQGGDIFSRDNSRNNDGTGDIGYNVDAEISDLVHNPGTVAMARRGNDLNSASSQFYICLKRLENLDGQYTVFAEVVQGMEVVNRIARVQKDRRGNPYERVLMKKVWVGTN